MVINRRHVGLVSLTDHVLRRVSSRLDLQRVIGPATAEMSDPEYNTVRRRKYGTPAEALEAKRSMERERGKRKRRHKPEAQPQILFIQEDPGSADWEAEGLTDYRARQRILWPMMNKPLQEIHDDEMPPVSPISPFPDGYR